MLIVEKFKFTDLHSVYAECEYLHMSLKQIRKYFVIRKRKTSHCYNYDACAQSTGLCMSQAPGGRNMKVQCCVHP